MKQMPTRLTEICVPALKITWGKAFQFALFFSLLNYHAKVQEEEGKPTCRHHLHLPRI
jgi:hypothetical protein